MRMIGHVGNEGDARVFSDFLYVQGIKNEVDGDASGAWAVWVHSEDELEQAKSYLGQFAANPGDPAYRQSSAQAERMRAEERKIEAKAAKRTFDGKEIFRSRGAYGLGLMTLSLMGACIVLFILTFMLEMNELTRLLMFSEVRHIKTFPEIRHGQVWRLVTPILLHGGYIHILFNMMWIRDLGGMVESRKGSGFLALFVVVTAILSNTGQYLISGPNFVGISGVVYGLFGYIWMKAKFDPNSGMYLHPSTVTMMLIWFAICFTGILPIANTVHSIGLITGVVWGYLTSLRR